MPVIGRWPLFGGGPHLVVRLERERERDERVEREREREREKTYNVSNCI